MPYARLEDRIAQRKRYYLANKDRWKNSDGTWKITQEKERRLASARLYVYHKFGVTDLSIDEVLANLSGICPICGNEADLVYDHDHATGLHRDWICNPCNLVLGFASDNINTLKGAIIYLEKFNGRG